MRRFGPTASVSGVMERRTAPGPRVQTRLWLSSETTWVKKVQTPLRAFSSHCKSLAHKLRPPRTRFISDCVIHACLRPDLGSGVQCWAYLKPQTLRQPRGSSNQIKKRKSLVLRPALGKVQFLTESGKPKPGPILFPPDRSGAGRIRMIVKQNGAGSLKTGSCSVAITPLYAFSFFRTQTTFP